MKWFANQKGYITFVTLLMIPVFILLLILVIDVGCLLAQKAELQGIADAMALASISGVYQMDLRKDRYSLTDKEWTSECYIDPELAKQRGYRYLDYLESPHHNSKLKPYKSKIKIEQITVNQKAKRVTVVISTQVHPRLLPWIKDSNLSVGASSQLDLAGKSKLVPLNNI